MSYTIVKRFLGIGSFKTILIADTKKKGFEMPVEDYSKLNDEEFNRILTEIVKENVGTLFMIPGFYEIASEYFNNDVLARFLEEQN